MGYIWAWVSSSPKRELSRSQKASDHLCLSLVWNSSLLKAIEVSTRVNHLCRGNFRFFFGFWPKYVDVRFYWFKTSLIVSGEINIWTRILTHFSPFLPRITLPRPSNEMMNQTCTRILLDWKQRICPAEEQRALNPTSCWRNWEVLSIAETLSWYIPLIVILSFSLSS